MENDERFEHLLQHYSYKELNDEDRQVTRHFVSSEEEYEALRKTTGRINHYFSEEKKTFPRSEVWEKIKSTWRGSDKTAYHWTKTPMPAYAAALALIAAGSIGWYAGSYYHAPNNSLQITQQVDTVFVSVRPDTVVRERVIYVKDQSPPTLLQVVGKNPEATPASRGVNMKEKEELEKLLVSGSM